jgi:type II secretory pathway component PulK
MRHNIRNRRGAALIVALVLLTVLGIVTGTVLPRILQDRQEARKDLVRTQSRQLLDDAIRSAESKRQSDSSFSGETLTLDSDSQPFGGTFQVTTRLEADTFVAEIEYRSEAGKVIYLRSPENGQ